MVEPSLNIVQSLKSHSRSQPAYLIRPRLFHRDAQLDPDMPIRFIQGFQLVRIVTSF